MTLPALLQTSRYRSLSVGDTGRDMSRLALVTAESGSPSAAADGLEGKDLFLQGRIAEPKPFADALLAVGRTARTRFFTPPGMVAKLIAESDPVITVDQADLRFESFSPCCGVHARIDVPLDQVDAEACRRGTTNVDVGPDLRRWLIGVDGGSPLGLRVGEDAFEVEDTRGAAIERKVELPARWLVGFLEIQSVQRRLKEVHTLSGPAALRALQGLPRAATKGGVALVPTPSGLRVGRPGSRGAFTVGGHERLRVLDGIATSLRSLRIFCDPSYPELPSPTAWVAELRGGVRLTILLSPERWRGFSGEGQALEALAGSDAEVVSAVRGALAWQGAVDASSLASTLGVDSAAVERALARLGTLGLLGFDLVQGRYFHRVLPFDLLAVERKQPRLRGAMQLVQAGGVRLASDEGPRTFRVGSGTTEYCTVLSGEIAGGGSCTCTWYAQHQGARGPCKHVLAAMMTEEGP